MKLIGMPGGIEIIILFYTSLIVLWIVALVNCLKNNFDINLKIIWVLVIIFIPFLGSILYLTIGKNQRIKQ
ncbi:MAG: hypothetical protein ACJAS3_003685 [Roseivirga sp.]|jgi:hypothetical protein